MNDETFVIAVNGNGMKNAGISDGDLIRCKKADSAKDGDIVYAYIGNGKGRGWRTLSRYREEEGEIRLYSETDDPHYRSFTKADSSAMKILGIFQNVIKWR